MSFPVLFLEIKPKALFGFDVYLLDQLVVDFFSIWAKRLSGEAVVGMSKGARCDRRSYLHDILQK